MSEHSADNDAGLPAFTSVEWVRIEGRGDLAVIAERNIPDVRNLSGRRVLIDGQEYDLIGVEAHAVPNPRGPYGLLVRTRVTPPEVGQP